MEDFKLNGLDVRVFSETDSTNNQAKLIAKQGYIAPILLVAERQTAGRGRLGRTFYSPKNTGLYMSYLYKTENEISHSVTITAAAAVAVVRAIKELTDLTPEIKWVNDIFIKGKKIAGILTEAVTDNEGVTSIVVGIGINISTEEFPEDIKSVAGSLGMDLSREQLAKTIVKHLQELINGLSQKTYLEDYKKHSCVLGCDVVYIIQGVEHIVTAVDIDDNGGLVVEHQNGSRTTLFTGEISIKIKG